MKRLCFALLTLFTVMGVQAQQVSLGLKAGVNFSSFTGDDSDMLNLSGRTGFLIGVTGEIMFTENLGVQPEVLYSSQGAKSDFHLDIPDFGTLSVDEFKVDYISIPILFKYYPIERLSLEIGPQMAFKVNSEVEGSMGNLSDTADFDDETESFEFGGAVGLGYELPIGLFLQARYVAGFTDVYKDISVKNSVFQLALGYKLKM